MIQTLLRISAFLFSLYGYASFFRKRMQFEAYTAWLAGILSIILVLYIAAYPGWLIPAGVALFIIGCLSAIIHIFENFRGGGLSGFKLHLSYLWIVFYALLFGSTLLVTRLEHYDNFSHWAVIVKFLYTQGQLPTAADHIITFTSYPMGSSLFVFYAALICGFDDSVMLIGQFIFIVSCVFALFSVIYDKRRILAFAIMFSFVAVFNHFNISIRMNNLLVDFIIPLLALAGIAGIESMQRNMKQMSLYFLLVAGTLGIIKSSAMFFSLILMLFYISRVKLHWKHQTGKLRLTCSAFLACVVAMLPALVWNLHVKLSFVQPKKEVILDSYLQLFSDRENPVVRQVADKFLSATVNLNYSSTQAILIANLMMLASFLFIRFILKRRNDLLHYCFLSFSITTLYYDGLYLTYLFSIPAEESIVLAGFERYSSSIAIFSLGIAMMVLVREIENSFFEQDISKVNIRSFKNPRTKILYELSATFLLFLSTMLLLSENNGLLYNKAHYNKSVPARFSALTENQMRINNVRYLIVSSDKENIENSMIGFVGMYYLYSHEVTGRENFDMSEQQFIKLLEEFDKVVILDEHYTFNAMTKKISGNQFSPGIYDTEELLAR